MANIYLAAIYVNAGGVTITAPDDTWIQSSANDTYSDSEQTLALYYHIVTDDEPSSYTFTPSAGTASAALVEYEGISESPFSVSPVFSPADASDFANSTLTADGGSYAPIASTLVVGFGSTTPAEFIGCSGFVVGQRAGVQGIYTGIILFDAAIAEEGIVPPITAQLGAPVTNGVGFQLIMDGALPPAPDLVAVQASWYEAMIDWTPSSDDTVTTYQIYRSTVSGEETELSSVPADTYPLTYSDYSCQADTTYYYTVAAVNPAGTGPQSTEASGTTGSTLPTVGTVTPTLGTGQIDLTWDAVTATPDISGYAIFRSTSSGQESLLDVSDSASYTDTDVVLGTTYYYEIAAMNSDGAAWDTSSEASITFAAGAPSQVTGLIATAVDGAVDLSWDTNADATEGYVIIRGTTSGGETTYASTSDVQFSDEAVTNGTTYYYEVAAVNTAGTGPYSAEASATFSDPTIPQVTGFTAIAGYGQISLSWDAVTVEGTTLNGYNVLRATTSGDEAYVFQVNSVQTSVIDSSLTDGTTYYYQIEATTPDGAGDPSAEVSATPMSGSAPGQVTGLTATPGNGEIMLSWDDVDATPTATYTVYEFEDPFVEGLTTTTYTATGLTNGEQYTFYVVATNDVNSGEASSVVDCTPEAS